MPFGDQVFRFGDFELDVAAYVLTRAGRRLRLERQPMELLILLVERRGTLVKRSDVRERLWPAGVTIEFDSAVHTAIRKIRGALQDSAAHPRFVEAVPGQGYRFIASVETLSRRPEGNAVPEPLRLQPAAVRFGEPDPHRSAAAAAWLALDWRERRVHELQRSYQWRHRALMKDLFWQFIVVVLALWTMTPTVAHPVLNDPGISTLPCFVLPAALLHLWLHFGFALDDVVKSRAAAWALLVELGPPRARVGVQ